MVVPLGIFDLIEGLGQIILGGILFIVAFAVVGHILGTLGSKAFDKADEEAKKGNGGWLAFIFLLGFACFVALWIGGCARTASRHNTEIRWSPRHT